MNDNAYRERYAVNAGPKRTVIGLVIYVVRPGDSVYSIARAHGVTPESVIRTNRLANPAQLVVGQALLLPVQGYEYTVRSGDTVYSIARATGASQASIFRANPQIPQSGALSPGQVLIIPAPEPKLGTIEVNGYIFPGSNEQVVRDALPSLTYLSVFSHEVAADGTLSTVDDAKWIAMARAARVAPIMVVANIRPSGGFSSDIAGAVLATPETRSKLIDIIASTMQRKNYYGVNMDLEYIRPEDRENYNQFLRELSARLGQLGAPLLTAVAPKVSATQQGLLYEAHDYPVHGEVANRVILMTYEWGYLAGPPQAVAPLDQVRRVLEYAVTAIPPQKILMGVPNYGYDWTLPYRRGTLATTFSNVEAVNRAFRNNAEIQFDQTAQSPFFNYTDAQGRQHVVWFEDVRSLRQKFLLVHELGLAGISYWTIERPFPQNLAL